MEESHHEDNIRVLIAEPGKKVYAKEIRNDWREMQMIVGGLIQDCRRLQRRRKAHGACAQLPAQ